MVRDEHGALCAHMLARKHARDTACPSPIPLPLQAGHTKGGEECWLLASSDSWRYAIFPSTGECCRVCNTSDYCGIVAPGWLQVNSTYVGRSNIAGMVCDGFVKEGGEQNYYYAEVGSGQPCLYYEGYPVLPLTSNYW